MILDEVQCGMGRTGTIMTYFQYDILPDILCLAKGIGAGFPMGAFVANKKFAAAMDLEIMVLLMVEIQWLVKHVEQSLKS